MVKKSIFVNIRKWVFVSLNLIQLSACELAHNASILYIAVHI